LYLKEEEFLKKGRILKYCICCRNNYNNFRNKNKCPHGKQKSRCFDCGGVGFCKHRIRKIYCIKCDGSFYCKHNLNKYRCKSCSKAEEIKIQFWIFGSKQSDKKYNRYDADRFIDKCFLKELIKDYRNCYYCEVELQYVDNNDTLATIERLDNSKGHIKSNCVIACRKCNLSKVGQRKLQHPD